jgi:protein disulfide-isomerase A1
MITNAVDFGWLSIVPFLRRALRPILSTVDAKNITSFVSVDDVVIVAHLVSRDDNLRVRFSNMANQFSDRYSFATADADEADEHSWLACFNNIDDIQRTTDELTTVQALENFIKECSTPMIPELTRRNEMEYIEVSDYSFP